MADSSVETHPHKDVHGQTGPSDSDVPTPEDIYNIPVGFVNCLIEIAPKIQQSGAWWSLSGDLGENLLDVHVRPTEIEIVTDELGLGKISSALSSYNLTPIAIKERRLDREAELDGNKYPVFEKCSYTEFTLKGTKVKVEGDYQLKVGEWEWGDTFFFDPTFVNVAGVQIPVMPLRLRSELYIVSGWGDRAKQISEAYTRAHAFIQPLMEGV
jgi:hypothetical protein